MDKYSTKDSAKGWAVIILVILLIWGVYEACNYTNESSTASVTEDVLIPPTEEEIQTKKLTKSELKRRDSIANKKYQERITVEYKNLEETDDASKPKALQEDIMPSREAIERQFNAWDGSHIKLTRLIKETMNDPESYEHVKTTFEIKRTYILVMTEFRCENSFGAKVKNTIVVKVDANGNIIELVSQY